MHRADLHNPGWLRPALLSRCSCCQEPLKLEPKSSQAGVLHIDQQFKWIARRFGAMYNTAGHKVQHRRQPGMCAQMTKGGMVCVGNGGNAKRRLPSVENCRYAPQARGGSPWSARASLARPRRRQQTPARPPAWALENPRALQFWASAPYDKRGGAARCAAPEGTDQHVKGT